MDSITRSPGLIHIAEQIFTNLERRDLLRCQEVNEYWASILRNPWFWYNRMTRNNRLSQEHQKEWMDFCEKLYKLNLTKDMTPGLNFIYKQLEDSVTLHKTYWSAIPRDSPSDSEVEDCAVTEALGDGAGGTELEAIKKIFEHIVQLIDNTL